MPGAGLGVVPGVAGVASGGGVAVGPGVSPGVRTGVGVGGGPVSSRPAGWLPAWHTGAIWSTRVAVKGASRRMAQRACSRGGMLMRVRIPVESTESEVAVTEKPALLFARRAAMVWP